MSKLSNPYDFVVDQDRTTFQTKRGVNYSCIFVLDEETEHLGLNLDSNFYQFLFFPDSPQGESYFKNDARIHQTIVKILHDFFVKNPEGVILYFCDDSDSKGKARHNLFEKWVKKYNGISPKKVLFNLSIDQNSVHIALLINENHPEITKLLVAVDKQINELKLAGKAFSFNQS